MQTFVMFLGKLEALFCFDDSLSSEGMAFAVPLYFIFRAMEDKKEVEYEKRLGKVIFGAACGF